MGVLGAALGTLLATILVTAAFVWGFLAGGLPGVGRFPLAISASGPYLDRPHLRELLSLSLPLMARRLAAVLVVFPILAIAAAFGPVVVAAFEVARQIRHLINAPNWGFGLAASSLVGQALGRADLAEARAYGRDVLRFSVAVFLVVSAVVLIAARPIAGVFADDPATIEATVPFLRIAAISAVGYGIDGTATGVLRGSGDTRWPFYGKLLGLYGVMLPVASLALTTPLGITALYVAMVAETAVPAAVTYYRFRSGAWLPPQARDGAVPVD
jgi:putative MATE family efflux protein